MVRRFDWRLFVFVAMISLAPPCLMRVTLCV